ncbi:hypothetical protein HPP92_004998 [Vanilla planifolia]|uniref:Uncharacterized protein n=1 Tax=Vanilla planifolia TaxID=51239 RepID=A0A835RG00_VANPL|nr:hypothetical protein HPP92_004998 [Vanilla planifolia]
MEAVGGGGDEAMEAAVGAVAGLAVVDRRADVVYVDAVVGEVCGELEESVEVPLGGERDCYHGNPISSCVCQIFKN